MFRSPCASSQTTCAPGVSRRKRLDGAEGAQRSTRRERAAVRQLERKGERLLGKRSSSTTAASGTATAARPPPPSERHRDPTHANPHEARRERSSAGVALVLGPSATRVRPQSGTWRATATSPEATRRAASRRYRFANDSHPGGLVEPCDTVRLSASIRERPHRPAPAELVECVEQERPAKTLPAPCRRTPSTLPNEVFLPHRDSQRATRRSCRRFQRDQRRDRNSCPRRTSGSTRRTARGCAPRVFDVSCCTVYAELASSRRPVDRYARRPRRRRWIAVRSRSHRYECLIRRYSRLSSSSWPDRRRSP